MFRARLPRAAFLAAAAAISVPTSSREKLSIYPIPDPELVLIDTPSELERRIGIVRTAVTSKYVDGHSYVQGWVSKWIGVEHAIERRVKSLIPPDESLTPGLLYVGVATLTGSIISRNRGLPLRVLLPPTLLILSLNQLLPKTSANLGEYISSLEHVYAPGLAKTHETAVAHTAMTWQTTKDAYARGQAKVASGVQHAITQVQDATGLKLREAFGWREGVFKQAEVKGKELSKAVEARAEEVREVVDKKVEEAKRLA